MDRERRRFSIIRAPFYRMRSIIFSRMRRFGRRCGLRTSSASVGRFGALHKPQEHTMRAALTIIALTAFLAANGEVALGQPASGPQASPDRAGENPRRGAIRKKRASCRADGTGKGLRDQDLADHVALCVQEARLACLKQAIEQKLRGAERAGFIDKCLGSN
jgi:hypothetical protein